jgi:hypothetical protein
VWSSGAPASREAFETPRLDVRPTHKFMGRRSACEASSHPHFTDKFMGKIIRHVAPVRGITSLLIDGQLLPEDYPELAPGRMINRAGRGKGKGQVRASRLSAPREHMVAIRVAGGLLVEPLVTLGIDTRTPLRYTRATAGPSWRGAGRPHF